MISISRRGLEAPSSPIRKLEPFAQAALQQQTKIYHLNIGQPDIATPDRFLQKAQLNSGSVLAYSPSAGVHALREAMAHYYKNLGLPVETQDVLVTTGGSEALLFTLMALCDAGDEVITPEPCYPNYRMFAMMAGAHICPLPTKIEDGFKLPSPAEFAAAVTPKTKAILLCNPSNPTGAVYSRADLQAVVDLCRQKNLVLIADEVYREFVYGGSPCSVMTLPGAQDVTVIIDSFSKRFSACGARIGFLVTKIRAVIDATTKFAMSRLSPPTLGQLGGLGILEDPEAFVVPMIAEFKRRRDVLAEELSKLDGVVFPDPKGAFYMMAKLPVSSTEEFCKWLLTDFRENGETVMLAPGPGFYVTPGLGESEVRIAYVLGAAPLRRAVQLLGNALQQYNHR